MSMRDYRRGYRDIDRGVRWTFGKLLVLFVILTLLAVPASLFFRGCDIANNMLDQGQRVITKKFGPEEQFAHYEWYKDASAQLESKLATLGVYEKRFKTLEAAYAGQPRGKWARDDREQWSIWMTERSGIAASYNDLASQWNAAMAKINWRYCNVGDLPAGETKPLPREYRPYATE